jgi:hypothetical protein
MNWTKGGGAATTRSAMYRYAGMTINCVAATAAVGNVTLTIRSSRSVLSENPCGRQHGSVARAWRVEPTSATQGL